MSCEWRRLNYWRMIAPAMGLLPKELEHIFQINRSSTCSKAQQIAANAKTLLLFAEMRQTGVEPPVHSKTGKPRPDAARGYAAVYDLLREAGSSDSHTDVWQPPDLGNENLPDVLDFHDDPAFHALFYRDPTPQEIAEFEEFLKRHPDKKARLFHGTSGKHNIPEDGLKPSTSKRAHSLQSQPGYVCLSVYPGAARTFGQTAYPTQKDIRVYCVEVPVRELRPDLDQLKNKRLWSEIQCGDTLAESLVIGHGARVKGKITTGITLHE